MILYEDNAIIVCHKPSGIPVQSAGIATRDMVSILNNYLAEKRMDDKKSEKVPERVPERVQVVHRLDQPVEGVIVFAKTKQAASNLSKQIADGKMKKIYQAVCCVTGQANQDFLKDDGEIRNGRKTVYVLEDYLVKNGRTNTSAVADKNAKDAKKAILDFSVLEITAGIRKCGETGADKMYLLAEIRLKTGRHHQIRVQMAHAGLPLYGDRKYNTYWQEFFCEEDQKKGVSRLALCASSLTFFHPVTGKRMNFQARTEEGAFGLFSGTANE